MEFRELFEPIINFIKGLQNKDKENSKDEAKKRLQLVLMQDRASVSPDFFEMMKKEIIEVIKKYIEIDEDALEVQLTRGFEDGVTGPALFANIPIKNIKPVAKKTEEKKEEIENKEETQTESAKQEVEEIHEEEIPKQEEPKNEEIKNEEVKEVPQEEIKEQVEVVEENKESVEESKETQERKKEQQEVKKGEEKPKAQAKTAKTKGKPKTKK